MESTEPTRQQEFSYNVSSGIDVGSGVIQLSLFSLGLKARMARTRRTSLFRRQRFVECPVNPTDPADPDSGCPG